MIWSVGQVGRLSIERRLSFLLHCYFVYTFRAFSLLRIFSYFLAAASAHLRASLLVSFLMHGMALHGITLLVANTPFPLLIRPCQLLFAISFHISPYITPYTYIYEVTID